VQACAGMVRGDSASTVTCARICLSRSFCLTRNFCPIHDEQGQILEDSLWRAPVRAHQDAIFPSLAAAQNFLLFPDGHESIIAPMRTSSWKTAPKGVEVL